MTIGAIRKGIERGEKRAIARAITAIENTFPESGVWTFRDRFRKRALWKFSRFLLRQRTYAWRIGVTGPSASGKSTVISHLAERFLVRGLRVAVIAIDPTGVRGALFGDRIRIGSHAGDPNFYLRSMATRGDERGLVRNLDAILRVLDAASFDVVVIETPGARQNDVAIRQHADTLLLVMTPQGDAVTFMKGGLTEVADIFAINQVDRYRENDVWNVINALREEISLRPATSGRDGSHWTPTVIETAATQRMGIPDLISALETHRAFLASQRT